MHWILGIIGLILGSVVGLAVGSSSGSDDAVGIGAVLGVAAGVALAQMLKRNKQAPAAPAAHSQAATRRPDPASFAGQVLMRVEQLEAEVEALKREVSALRSGAAPVAQAAAPAAAPNAASDAVHLPSVAANVAAETQALVIPQIIAAAPAEPQFEPVVAMAEPAYASADNDLPHLGAAAMPPAPQRPAQPRQPDIFDRLFQAGRDWLLGGNTVVRVGIVVLFFGIAFLLKFAADNSLLPVEFRLAGVVLGAVALLVTGWRIGDRKGAYGLVLQGGGIGVLYLTGFAAVKLYHLVPAGLALPLMILICIFSAFLAVRQNAAPLAFMGSAGGFLAPVLLSSGGGSQVALFSYYALLNAGIFAIAWFKAWRPLNVLGFAFTFVIGAAWGFKSYEPALFWGTEPFLILFFLMYVGIALLYALRREWALKHYVDGTLVFGVPLVAMGLQTGLMHGVEFGLAFSAVALSAFYLAVAMLLQRQRARLAILFEAMLALGILFATLAVPLAFSGQTTSATWALEGAALVWLGVRQRRLLPLVVGSVMQLGAAAAFVVGVVIIWSHPYATPVLNSDYIATLLLAVSGVFSGWRLATAGWQRWMPRLGVLAALWGWLWWYGGGMNEIDHYASSSTRHEIAATVLFVVFSAWVAHGARLLLRWSVAEWPALALIPLLAMLTLVQSGESFGPMIGWGIAAWPVALVSGYALLWRQRHTQPDQLLAPLHTLLFFTLCVLLMLQAWWSLHAYVPEGSWGWSGWAYGYGVMLLLVVGAGRYLPWPVQRYARAYQWWGALPLAALLWLWSLISVQSDGNAAPLPWVPVLNPMDVAQALVVLAVVQWLRCIARLGVPVPRWPLQIAAGATGFIWLNCMLLRTLHHWAHVPYELDALMQSTLVQAVVSVFWTICALLVMVWSTRRAWRSFWFVGGGLLAVTVVKLFFFDLHHVQGIQRIGSFIGIGIMLLLIGYFSPLPPRTAAPAAEAAE